MFPKPPEDLFDITDPFPRFKPAHELRDWAYSRFIEEEAQLFNEDHEHLNEADILFVWSATAFKRREASVVGTAQLGAQQGGSGKKEFLESVYRQMNGGRLPDFIITIAAPYVVEASESAICALIEHELYHCSFQRDKFGGQRRNRKTRELTWAMKGHDIEEFTGVVKRYGAYSPELQRFAGALKAGPSVEIDAVEWAVCGCGAPVGEKV